MSHTAAYDGQIGNTNPDFFPQLKRINFGSHAFVNKFAVNKKKVHK
jgi:hypothetical protein